MQGQIFKTIFDGTLRGRADAILVLINLIANATRKGVVDRHFKAIADETGLTLERVQSAIAYLQGADPESRSPESDGRRIISLDEHRNWGWQIVNFHRYWKLCQGEFERESNRQRQEFFRKKKKNDPLDDPNITRVQPELIPKPEPPAEPPIPKPKPIRPTLEQIKAEFAGRNIPEIEAEKFFAHYESVGWRVGKNPMKSLNGAIAGWKIRYEERAAAPVGAGQPRIDRNIETANAGTTVKYEGLGQISVPDREESPAVPSTGGIGGPLPAPLEETPDPIVADAGGDVREREDPLCDAGLARPSEAV